MKVMKKAKVSVKSKGKAMKLNKKNLAALPQPMALEQKIEMYQKKGCTNIDSFLSNLTKEQREALWQKFNYNRKADPTVQDLWSKKCNGAGSMPDKKKLLNIFIQQGLSCKGQPMSKAIAIWGTNNENIDLFVVCDFVFSMFKCVISLHIIVTVELFCSHQALIEMNRTNGQKEEESWMPFQTMLRKFGLAELMRRIQKGTITARKDPDDDDEWQFRDIVVIKYMDNSEKSSRQAEKSGKMDLESWMTLKSKSMTNQGYEPDANVPLPLVSFLKSQGASKDLAIKEGEQKATKEGEEDPDIAQAERLSQLGGAGVKAKAKVKEMLDLGNKVMNETGDKDLKAMLRKKLQKVEKMSNGKVKVEDLKTALIDVYTTIKKVKKAESIV